MAGKRKKTRSTKGQAKGKQKALALFAPALDQVEPADVLAEAPLPIEVSAIIAGESSAPGEGESLMPAGWLANRPPERVPRSRSTNPLMMTLSRGADRRLEPILLSEFYNSIYIADGVKRSRNYLHRMGTAIRAFYRFYSRRGARLVDIRRLTDANLRRFVRWLRGQGVSAESAGEYRKLLRTVMRSACPERFPRITKQRPRPLMERTLRAFFEGLYVPQKLLAASQFSISEYRSTLNALDDFLGRAAIIDDLCDGLAQRFMQELLRRGRRPATVNKHRAQLLAMWRLAKRRGLVEVAPDVDKLKGDKPKAIAWSPEELQRIVTTAEGTEGFVVDVPSGLFWTTFVLTLFWTGSRVGAMLRVRPEHFDRRKLLLRVPAEFQKHGADEIYRLPPSIGKLLEAILAYGHTELFPTPNFTRHGRRAWLAERYREILERAGLPHGPKDLFHKLRRTTATQITKNKDKQSASTYLGHSSPQVTDAYVDTTQLDSVNVTEALQLPRVSTKARHAWTAAKPKAK
jgi:integrase